MLPRKAQSGATDAEKQAITSKGDALRAQANAVNAPIVEYSGWMDEYLDIPKTFAGDRAARLAKGKELHSDRYTEKNDREGLPCRHSMPNQLYFEVKAHGATYRIRVDHGKNAVVTPKDVRLGG